ncbi:hypothetical protein [Spiroplasma sp. AdecLV25b]|uniref:hypothetical protein n=1 Tax=Spiroplasma sp. AdecLV25b TaxID=3027162 RepID=UPI0027E15C79|nr:hypothetical protein [Spiroplasma sp. AdecLV25b]
MVKKKVIDGFLEVLKSQILTISNNLVVNYPELKPLFNGINPNDILKINTNDLDDLLINKVFDWVNNDFGLKSFKPNDYNITNWYHLIANLTLDFTCLGENAKIHTTPIKQTYDMYFANDGADLNQVVTVVSNNVKEKLNSINCIKLEYDKWDDSFVNQQNNIVLPDIKKKLMENQDLKNIKSLEIDTQSIANPYNNDYNFMNVDGNNKNNNNDNFPLSLPESQRFISNSANFNKGWNSIIAVRESNFASRLSVWETKNNVQIANQDNVFVFGEYQTRNWKIGGLEIKAMPIQYYITSTGKSRAKNTSESLKILENLFVGQGALFQYNKNYNNIGWSSYGFNIILNSVVYDDFINRDVIVQKIYDYVTKQTNDFGTKNGFINPNDTVKWTTDGSTTWLTNVISNVINRKNLSSHNNWRLVINGNAFSMCVNWYGYTNFTISKSDTNSHINCY